MLKFLRFVHIFEMFGPIKLLIDWLYKGKKDAIRRDRFQLVVLFTSALLLGHLCACAWISLGTRENGWLTQLQTLPEDDGGDAQFAIYTPNQIYIFSLYWIFEVLSTVGYGDYAGAGTEEFLFTIFLEFCGITFFALLTGLIPPLVEPEKDFQKLLLDKTF